MPEQQTLDIFHCPVASHSAASYINSYFVAVLEYRPFHVWR